MKIFLTLFLIIHFKFCFSQEHFNINGSVKNLQTEKVFIEYQSIDSIVVDSSNIQNGKFAFKGSINGPTIATLKFPYNAQNQSAGNTKRNSVNIFMEEGDIVIKQDSNSTKVDGSETHQFFESFIKKGEPDNKMYNSLYKGYQGFVVKNDSPAMKQNEKERNDLEKKIKESYREEYVSNPGSPIAVYLLNIYTYAGWETDAVDFDTLFAKLPLTARSTSSGKILEKKLNTFFVTKIGTVAPEFFQNDTASIPISLSSFRGKFLLIAFWASWCVPCRKENPNYVLAYNKFSNKGFDILAVSLDDDKNAWIKAINADKLNWTHVSDLNFSQNAVAQKYGIAAIPRNILIDPQGIIIAKDLRGADLAWY
jgi:peroxiredoxin